MRLLACRFAPITIFLATLSACVDAPDPEARREGTGSATFAPTNDSIAEPQAASVARVDGLTLRLEGCRLTASSESTVVSAGDLDLSDRCDFAVDAGGSPQIVSTPAGRTLMVLSSDSLPDGRFCDTRIRAIVALPSGLLVSTKSQEIRSCSRGPHDEVMFHTLATDVVPIGR